MSRNEHKCNKHIPHKGDFTNIFPESGVYLIYFSLYGSHVLRFRRENMAAMTI